jgi:hypothetical protein
MDGDHDFIEVFRRKCYIDLVSCLGDTVPTEIDWARLAAYIDGEGSIYITESTRRRPGRADHRVMAVTICVVNTDPRLIRWCKENFGGNTGVMHKKVKRHRTSWAWRIASGSAVNVLKGCYQYFIVKKEQADLAIAFQETVKYRKGRPHKSETWESRAAIKLQLSKIKTYEFRDIDSTIQ